MNSPDNVLEIRSLSKVYQIYERSRDRLKQALSVGRRKYYREFRALNDVSFDVRRGETMGILGCNGSGKSTLLQIIFGTMSLTQGTVTRQGRISALLELGAGFDGELTGRENVYLHAAILGLPKDEIDDRFDEIASFAGIGEFMDQPVRTYSSGMHVRLAFAVAINVDPDILIVDEALAVGDARFQQRCIDRIRKFREKGVSILFVSHDIESIRRICDRAIVLNQGQIVQEGPATDVANWYLRFVTNDYDLKKTHEAEAACPAAPAIAVVEEDDECSENASSANLPADFHYFRHGDGDARIVSASLVDEAGRPVDRYELGSALNFRCEVEFYKPLDFHIIGLHIRDQKGTDVIVLNTYQEQTDMPPVAEGDRLSYTITCPLDIKPGYYSISATVAYDQFKLQWMDWIDCLLVFRVVDPQPERLIFGVHYPQNVEITCKPARSRAA